MKFRPCIDIHNGQVKQIVGSSLKDQGNIAKENYISEYDGSYYGNMYKQDGLYGGHIIILNAVGSEYYEASKKQAMLALKSFEGGLQIGGGINDTNAKDFLLMGASHVIVTSYVFKDGQINYDNLNKINKIVGKEHLVLDLSCRKKDDKYYIVTDRWQKYTDTCLNEQTINELMSYCDEFLIHAVDVEGKQSGVEERIVELMGSMDNIKATYAGGISSINNIETIKLLGKDKIDFTVGSALDIFGGTLPYSKIKQYC